MTPENVMDLAHRMLLVTSMIAAPLLLIALVAGLVIGMLQAATQINEATLSFIPKLLLLVLTLFVAGPWILRVLDDFTRDLYTSIPADDRLGRHAARHPQCRRCVDVGEPPVVADAARRRLRPGGADRQRNAPYRASSKSSCRCRWRS